MRICNLCQVVKRSVFNKGRNFGKIYENKKELILF
jgi:hypothetical protein